MSKMLTLLPSYSGVCMQGEDEIASIGLCLGASMAGLKVMTATSGPGISLYSEQISFAIGSEIPIVIVDVQRLGPSTGSATRGADGDIQFLRWGSSSGQPAIVLAPVDVKDCYDLTRQAFNFAEEFRCPVFIASNKEIAMTRESIHPEGLSDPPVVNRKAPEHSSPYLPFQVKKGEMVPDFLPIGDETLVRQTSSTHGPSGYITTNPEEILAIQNRLKNKIEQSGDRLSLYEAHIQEKAKTLVITYGVTARAARHLYQTRIREGEPISLLILKTLWPVPEKIIRDIGGTHTHILVVEMNLGLYVREIERLITDRPIRFFGQMNGRLITPHQIGEALP
jgi:2-oxoglutarate ferredoxin oxidoreductase subunit alpha